MLFQAYSRASAVADVFTAICSHMLFSILGHSPYRLRRSCRLGPLNGSSRLSPVEPRLCHWPLSILIVFTGLSPPSVGFFPPFLFFPSFRSPLLKKARLISFPLLRCFTSRSFLLFNSYFSFFTIFRTPLYFYFVSFYFLNSSNKISIHSRK